MRQSAAGGAFPGIQKILFVDKSSPATVGADGSAGKPFNTLGAARTAAIALTPAAGNQILVYFFPGIYQETLALDTEYIFYEGVERETCIIEGQATAAVTLACDKTGLKNCTVTAINAGSIPLLDTTASHVGTEVQFIGVIWSERYNQANAVEINHNNIILFKDCEFRPYAQVILHIHGSSAIVRCMDCDFNHGSVDLVDHDAAWPVLFQNCHFNDCEVQDASASVGNVYQFESCVFENCVDGWGVYLQKECSAYFSACTFDDYTWGGIRLADDGIFLSCVGCSFLTAGVNSIYSGIWMTAHPARIVGCLMAMGMSQYVDTVDPIKRVGGDYDCYDTLANALYNCKTAGDVVQLQTDVAVLAALTPPGTHTVSIDGQGRFTITRAAGSPVFNANAECDIRFRQIRLVGSIDITAAAAKVSLLDQTLLTGMVDITSGATSTSRLFMDQAKIVADATDHHAIAVGDADAEIYIFRSYLKGNGTEPAIDNPADNAHIHIAHSTVMNGTSANAPMAAAGTPAFSSHHNTYGADPAASGYANNIGTPYDVVDADGDWDWMVA